MRNINNKKIVVMLIILIVIFIFLVITFSFKKRDDSIFVYFFAEGGTPVDKIKINIGDNVILPVTSRDGYQFLGWYKSGIKVSNLTRYNETSTLFAKWLKNETKKFTISFDSNGGTKVDNLIIECNKALRLPLNPVKEGYEFVSWLDKDNNPILDESMLECKDITLKAEWKQITEKKEENKEIKYTCPNGYNLVNKKCSIEKTALERCPNGSNLDNNICISQTDVSNSNNICKNIDVETSDEIKNLQGEYFDGKCGYYVYDLKQDECKYTWDNNKCYAKVIEGGFDLTCNDGYLLKDNSCKKIIEKELYCENGYNLKNNKCFRTIDATIR